MKTLLVLRHGHAEQVHKETPQDYDRRLTERGREEAHRSGRKAATVLKGDVLILASAAQRTQETARAFAEALGHAQIQTYEHLYHATADDWLNELAALEDTVEAVVLVGHNPSVSELCTRLSGRLVDLPTGGVKGFVTREGWEEARRKPWEEVVFP